MSSMKIREIKFSSLSPEEREAAAEELISIMISSPEESAKGFQLLLALEVQYPGTFNSYDLRDLLHGLPFEPVSEWLYQILRALPEEKLGDGIGFFAHEHLFSYDDYLALCSIPQNYVAGMLKDDLLMTSERILAECYSDLGAAESISLETFGEPPFEGKIIRLKTAEREFESLRSHWEIIKKLAKENPDDGINEKLKTCRSLLFAGKNEAGI